MTDKCYSPDLMGGSGIGVYELVLEVDWPNTFDFSGGEGLGRAGPELVGLLKGLGLMRVIALTGAWGVAVVIGAWLHCPSTTELTSCDNEE